MFHKIALTATIALSLLWTTAALADVNMQDGMWEITMKMEMAGMPMEMPPMKFSQCLTKKDPIPQEKEKNEDCKIISNKIEGNTVSWVVRCRTKDGTIDSNGKITYRGSSFDGVINAVVNNARSGKMEMTQYMSGKRIGGCK